MATPVGAILCVGMLGLATVILLVMAVASAFIVIPAEDETSVTVGHHAGRNTRTREHHYSTAV